MKTQPPQPIGPHIPWLRKRYSAIGVVRLDGCRAVVRRLIDELGCREVHPLYDVHTELFTPSGASLLLNSCHGDAHSPPLGLLIAIYIAGNRAEHQRIAATLAAAGALWVRHRPVRWMIAPPDGRLICVEEA